MGFPLQPPQTPWIPLDKFVLSFGSVEAAEKRIRESEDHTLDPKQMGNGISVRIMMGMEYKNDDDEILGVASNYAFLWDSHLTLTETEAIYKGDQQLQLGNEITITIPRSNWWMVEIMFV